LGRIEDAIKFYSEALIEINKKKGKINIESAEIYLEIGLLY
jgi:hypothetical protein